MGIDAKYALLAQHVDEKAMKLLINFAGYCDEVLDFIAEEYGIEFP